LIGAIKAEQSEQGRTDRNDRIIAVADQSVFDSDVNPRDDLNPKMIEQINAFFVNYQKVEASGLKCSDTPIRSRQHRFSLTPESRKPLELP